MSTNLSEICDMLNGELVGDGSINIVGIAEVESAESGQITFISNKKYENLLNDSQASAVIISEDMEIPAIPTIRVKDPQVAQAKTLQYFYPKMEYDPGVDQNAIVADDATIGEGSYIGAGAVIKSGAVIGKGCQIMENVVIDSEVIIGEECRIDPGVVIFSNTTIGNRVQIGSCTVIGGEGFGYIPDGKDILKVPQVGRVEIEDDVSIGSNCCVDRATIGVTRIRRGAKLDNLIQIAHNVEVGVNTVMAGQSGIAGSTKVGNGVMIGGQSGVGGHIKVGDGAKIASKSAVIKMVKDNQVVSGIPARDHRKNLVKDASLGRIPKLVDKIKFLEKEVAKLNARLGKDER